MISLCCPVALEDPFLTISYSKFDPMNTAPLFVQLIEFVSLDFLFVMFL